MTGVKRFAALLLMLLMICSAAYAESAFTAGEYTASAAGRNGNVTVNAAFDSDAIIAIRINSVETETIGVSAMDAMAEQVLTNQSLGIDNIAGATISCEAFMAALADCVQQAGGDVEAMKAVPVDEAASEEELVTEADVIVVGAGGAGLTAAVTAAERGASVILLEKSGMVGGNTLCATMGINAAESAVQKAAGITATVEDFVAAQMNNEDARENLVRALCEKSGETIDWLSSLGVEFTTKKNSDFMLMATADGKTSETLINAIYKALTNTDVKLYMNTCAKLLVTDETGRVTGVQAVLENGEEIVFTGKAVILATGGFGQNQELLGQVRPDLATAITDEIAPTTGEGLLMAQALGAKTVNLDSIQLFPHVINGYGLLTPNNIPGGFHPDAIFVNQHAERFAAEGFEISAAILAQQEGMAYCIFTEDKMNDALRTIEAAGFVVSEDDAAGLAEKLGLDGAALAATLEAWNADCAAGADSLFGRTDNLNPITGKLYAYNFGVGAHYFMGGLLINENTQVLNEEEQPIEGLYAAGEVTGGFHGTFRVDGCGTADAFVFGRIAGEKTAEAALRENEADLNRFLSMLTEGKTDWAFAEEMIDEADLDLILAAGVNTASAINEQPWLINVVTNRGVIEELADTEDSKKAPLMILISVNNSNDMKILDAGLLCQNMQIAARALGYATKIETAPARIVRKDQTGKYAELFGIPQTMSARAALFIGYHEADALSGASMRKSVDEVVTYVK